MATDHWVRKIKIFNDGLQLSLVVFSDLATKDHGNFFRLADGAIGIQQSLAELIKCRPPVKDQVVAIFDLSKEEPVLTARFLTFAFFEEWSQTGKPFLPATQQVVGGQGICQFLKLVRMAAFEECIRALLKI